MIGYFSCEHHTRYPSVESSGSMESNEKTMKRLEGNRNVGGLVTIQIWSRNTADTIKQKHVDSEWWTFTR